MVQLKPDFELSELRDVDLLDEILHHPDVWKGAKDDSTSEDLSMSDVVQNPDNIVIGIFKDKTPEGFMAFIPQGDGLYEMHTNFLPSFRGGKALDAGWAAVAWVFRNAPAEKIVTYVFSTARPAKIMMRLTGWKCEGEHPYEHTVDGQIVTKIYFSLTRSEWEQRIK